MTNDEAKFLLTAYRPGGRDNDDPALAAAIGQAQRDPELQQWWARSQSFDLAISAKLREVAPPPGLREAILAGAKASQVGRVASNPPKSSSAKEPRSTPTRSFPYATLALAAALIALLSVVALRRHAAPSNGGGLSAFAQFALNDAHQGGHLGDPDQAFDKWLSTSQAPLGHSDMPISAAELASHACRSLDFGGTKVFEVCFNRGGIEYHLYLQPKAPETDAAVAQHAEFSDQDGAAAAWSDSHFVYALATKAGSAMLRRVL